MAKKLRTLKQQNFVAVGSIHLVLALLSIIFVIPLLWLIATSLSTEKLAGTFPPQFIPNPVMWGNYKTAFNYQADQLGGVPPMLIYGRNSLIVCILVVAGTVISNAIVAYSFARLKWPGRDLAFSITLATMMIPFPVLMVPLYAMYKDFGWIGTFRPLWVPAWFAGAFNIFLLRQFFRTIPFELSEAAKIDGCSEWGIFQQIILPLAKPALAVVALFSFMAAWNEFLAPMLYLQSRETFTLPLGLSDFKGQAGGSPIHLLMAASTMVVAPVIILFFFAQKQFIQGIATSGLKG